jgi:lysophospholipase L1-like esterase
VRSLTVLFAAVCGLSGALGFAAPDDARPVEDANRVPTQEVRDRSLPTVFLVGDSTVKVGTAEQKGWGQEIGEYFDFAKVNVVNRAIGGRSSRTFITEGRWDKVLADLKPGDFVIVQFGHNDAGKVNDDSRARGTLKGIGEETEEIDNILTKKHEVVHTYGWYLRKYIADTRAKGATPILCSLVPRKIWTDEGRIQRTPHSYAAWAREVAAAEGVFFLDLHEIIARRYEMEGKATVDAYFADAHTHTTALGAKVSAACVVSALQKLPGNPLGPFFSKEAEQLRSASAK